jgi:hypothetical protein
MDELTKELLKFLGCTLAGLAGLMAVGVYFANWANEVQCRNTAEKMGLAYHYSMSTPCMVDWHGQWLPLKSIYKVN